MATKGILMTLLVGIVLGAAGAAAIFQLLRRFWVPDLLQNAVVLALVVVFFVLSNGLQHESGFLTVTVMGALLANQKNVEIRHIVEFKEHIRVLLISSLFILLAATVRFDGALELLPRIVVFVLVLVLVARPLSVLVSTFGSSLRWPERAFLMAMAPRGIVAAAVASVFAAQLEAAGFEEAKVFPLVTFGVIIGTVAIYGLGSRKVAEMLGVAGPPPQGVFLVGAGEVAREFGRALQAAEIPVLLVDANHRNVQEARLAGLDAVWGSALDEHLEAELDLDGYGKMIALTPNDEVNRLAARHYAERFGRAGVFRLASAKDEEGEAERSQQSMGRVLGASDMTTAYLSGRLTSGARLRTTKLSETFGLEELTRERHGLVRPLFRVKAGGELSVVSADGGRGPQPGESLIYLGEADQDED